MTSISGWELFLARKNIHLTSLEPDLSRPLGRFFDSCSWFRPGQIVEIAGLLELGIIDVIISCVVTASIPKSLGGMGMRVAIIDSDGNVSVDKLYLEIERQIGSGAEQVMTKIQIARVLDEQEFIEALEETPPLEMLVIASISSPIRKSTSYRATRIVMDQLQSRASTGTLIMFASHVSQVPGMLWTYQPAHGPELVSICDTRIMIYSTRDKVYARLSKPTMESELVIELNIR